jgi:hypothetical protein
MRAITVARKPAACREKFLDFFPDGFDDETYLETERAYKWNAHRAWVDAFGASRLSAMVASRRFEEVARTALRVESRTNLLFSFEKIAIRDAVRTSKGRRDFAVGLDDWISARGDLRGAFERWVEVITRLPRQQTRVASWPVLTVFGFLARPSTHIYLKPTVTRVAADAYGFDLDYSSKPSWKTYASALTFARRVRHDLADLGPRDMIDVQSFLWVLGSSEYE